jgi:sialate O-acetylesterase
MKTLFHSLVLLVLVASAFTARAAVTLPAIFSDQMVLQRDARVPVWGTADAGTVVTVEFAGQKKTATAAPDGRWRLDLDPLAASATPRDLLISTNRSSPPENRKLTAVLVGEVWLGSGQSNMAMTVNRSANFETEKTAANFPLIRHYKEDSPNS